MKDMRKFFWIAAVFLMAAVFLLGGCGTDEKLLEATSLAEEDAPSAAVDKQAPPILPMTEQELTHVESAFDVMLSVNGEMEINPLNCFLTSYYDSVAQLDLSAFLRYFPGSEDGSEAEFEALRALEGWPFAELDSMKDMPVPLRRYSAESVRAALEKYGQTSLEKLQGNNREGVYYLEDYDAFYNYTSDFGLMPLQCTRGEKQGNILRVNSNDWDGTERVLTLEKHGEEYIVIAHQQLSN